LACVEDLSLDCFESEVFFGKDHGSDKSFPVFEIVLSLDLERLELLRIFLEVKTEKNSGRRVAFFHFAFIAFVFFLHEIFV
jgi:hypothetical protein